MNHEQWERIARLWLAGDYSPYDIAQELHLPTNEVSAAVDQIDKLGDIIKAVLLEKIKSALDVI